MGDNNQPILDVTIDYILKIIKMENNNDNEDNGWKHSKYEFKRGKRIKRNHVCGVLHTVDPNTMIASATTNETQHEKYIFFQEGSIELHILYSILRIRPPTHDNNDIDNNDINVSEGDGNNNDDIDNNNDDNGSDDNGNDGIDNNNDDGSDDDGNDDNNSYNNNDYHGIDDDGNDDDIDNNDIDEDDGRDADNNLSLKYKESERVHVLNRIEFSVAGIPKSLSDKTIPKLLYYVDPYSDSKSVTKEKLFNDKQGQRTKKMLLVMGYCHPLLRCTDRRGRTKTSYIQTLWYTYRNYFGSIEACYTAIQDTCHWLQVSRLELGLKASSKGWCCGGIKLMDHTGFPQWNVETYHGDQGFSITSEWMLPPEERTFSIDLVTSATCIVVVESESFYQILVQDSFWLDHECILVTGKGFPDIATRACVFALHNELHLPVYGLADCNPYGIEILYCYQNGFENKYGVPLQWLGLRPSQVKRFLTPQVVLRAFYPGLPKNEYQALSQDAFQELTCRDQKKLIKRFLKVDCTHPFITIREASRAERVKEIRKMLKGKVELEAMNCLGRDFSSKFLGHLLDRAKQKKAPNEKWKWSDVI
jgi:hypothetical protein